VAYKTLAMADTLIRRTAARYLIKCDDDTFLRLDRLLALIESDGAPPLYMGYISPSGTTNRDPTDRYYIARSVYPPDTIPSFAHGPAYVVSRELAGYAVAGVHRGHLAVLPLEDVAMASWMDHARRVGGIPVRYVANGHFRLFGCGIDAINGHYITPAAMRCMWQKVEAGNQAWCC
jgi:hydroxyproline O-galactosyltransferase 2/3/4/5/6